MDWPTPRRWWLVLLLGLLAIGQGPTSGQQESRRVSLPTSINDPQLESLRKASITWEFRAGPTREVVNQVCLVPDLPTFFEAIATWDSEHYFPVLIDDVETSFRFIRAFKPARIVRLPRSAKPIPEGKTWEQAVAAVAASWSKEANPAAYKPAGDTVPKGLGPTPPGVVLSSPTAPMLAGAVALAAGRFQPLLRLDFPRRFADVLSPQEIDAFNETLTAKVKSLIPRFESQGDECDFLTVAGDWPFRYKDDKGELEAVDDRLGRSTGSNQRWAYAGRILGDPTQSVYQAMCGLFLQPESALMFNGYEEASPPWSTYSMRTAASRLNAVVRTSQVSGEKQANLDGWHETFDPSNRHGLILINSHGSSRVFNIRGGPASTSDIPQSVPTAVLMIHSFSAADPTDPSTIAGRWLANGAFVYFGSMNEPFLHAFRLPPLVGNLIGERLPLVAAVRTTPGEPYSDPWRLVFLGDPLYRLRPESETKKPRLASWEPTSSWPAYAEVPRPAKGSEFDLLLWSLKVSLARLQTTPATNPPATDELVETLLAINRARLSADVRPIYDALLTETLLQARKRSILRARIAAIPEAERTPSLLRTSETLLAIDLNLVLARKDASAARAAWRELMKTSAPREFKEQTTSRVGQLADTPIRRHDWSLMLRAALRDRPGLPENQAIASELKRVDEALKKDR